MLSFSSWSAFYHSAKWARVHFCIKLKLISHDTKELGQSLELGGSEAQSGVKLCQEGPQSFPLYLQEHVYFFICFSIEPQWLVTAASGVLIIKWREANFN